MTNTDSNNRQYVEYLATHADTDAIGRVEQWARTKEEGWDRRKGEEGRNAWLAVFTTLQLILIGATFSGSSKSVPLKRACVTQPKI